MNLTDEESARMEAVRLLEVFRYRTEIRISVGITFLAPEGDTYELLIRRADLGLYQAKEQGRDRFVIVH